jgi:hypothetical protein
MPINICIFFTYFNAFFLLFWDWDCSGVHLSYILFFLNWSYSIVELTSGEPKQSHGGYDCVIWREMKLGLFILGRLGAYDIFIFFLNICFGTLLFHPPWFWLNVRCFFLFKKSILYIVCSLSIELSIHIDWNWKQKEPSFLTIS